MTNEQATWLNQHRAEGYRVVGRAPSGARWIRTGILHANGVFEAPQGNARPSVGIGSIEVGVLEF